MLPHLIVIKCCGVKLAPDNRRKGIREVANLPNPPAKKQLLLGGGHMLVQLVAPIAVELPRALELGLGHPHKAARCGAPSGATEPHQLPDIPQKSQEEE